MKNIHYKNTFGDIKSKNHNNGFTLIEILVGILIFSVVIIGGFQALSAVTIGKIKLIEETNIEKEAFYFSEKIFEEIKKGGLADYEEYFNRKVVNIGKSTLYSSGHYYHNTGFGNFGGSGNVNPVSSVNSVSYGNNFYYCVSPNSGIVGTGGCVESNNNSSGTSTGRSSNYSGSPQRYGQYSFQFIDYNSNSDKDGGDEDGDGKITGDYDDDYLGLGPEVFTGGVNLKELYLISGDKTKRTIFRWNVKTDPNIPASYNCDFTNPESPTGSGCLGTVEFLKLDGVDFGMDHNVLTSDSNGTQYDGVIDTWLVNKEFTGGAEVIAGSNTYDYFIPLFSESISVKDFKVFVYPNKDLNNAWRDTSIETNIAPYVRISMSLIPSFKSRKKIKGRIPEVNISTTISLSDIFSK